MYQKFNSLSGVKLREGVFAKSDIRKLISVIEFAGVMNNMRQGAWISFKEVISKILDNKLQTNCDKYINKAEGVMT